jgi:hypothetical protein
MKTHLGLLLAVLIAVSCSTNPANPTSTELPTVTSQPSLVPLSDLVLDDLIILQGDLPIGYGVGQIKYEIEGVYADIARKAQLTISQEISQGNELAGGVIVLLYDDIDYIPIAYRSVVNGYIDGEFKSANGPWDAATVSATIILSGTAFETKLTDMVFYHCHALVEFRYSGLADEAAAIAYATRLDKRLTPLICR